MGRNKQRAEREGRGVECILKRIWLLKWYANFNRIPIPYFGLYSRLVFMLPNTRQFCLLLTTSFNLQLRYNADIIFKLRLKTHSLKLCISIVIRADFWVLDGYFNKSVQQIDSARIMKLFRHIKSSKPIEWNTSWSLQATTIETVLYLE